MNKLLVLSAAALACGSIFAADAKPQVGYVAVEWSAKDGEKWDIGGLADHETGREMTKDTIFAIASNTKPITSVLLLTFVEEGKLSLDDKVSKYFPAYAELKYKKKPVSRELTVRDLVTHLSGLAYDGAAKGRKLDMTPLEEQVEILAKRRMRNDVGKSWQYCGAGFSVAGAILEKITGRKVADLMKERIFDPLEMNDTTFYPSAELLKRAAPPYYFPKDGSGPHKFGWRRYTEPLDNPSRTPGLAGGLFSTVPDYLKFSQMLVRKGVGLNGKRILSEKTCNEILFVRQTPPGDKKDASFDIHFTTKDPTYKGVRCGKKGGLYGTCAVWDWENCRCRIRFIAKSPKPPKGVKGEIDTSSLDQGASAHIKATKKSDD